METMQQMNNDESTSNNKNSSTKRSWLEKLTHAITGEPQTKKELLAILKDGAHRGLVDHNSLKMLEGVLEVHDLRAKDVMIPRSQMVIIEDDMQLEKIIDTAVHSGHSRFPVIGENKDEILGSYWLKIYYHTVLVISALT